MSSTVNPITRSVLFHPGTHYVAGNAAVMYLHSSCGGMQEFKNPNIQWDVMANQKAILVVSPLGAAPQPNPGACKWNSWWTPWDTTVPPDDGAFIRALLLDTSNRLGADPQKRFITGWSAGSDLISRILVTSGDLVKAAAVVEGHWTGFDDLDTLCGSTVPCTGKFIPPMPTPVNVMIIRGENGAMRICSSNSHESTVDEEFTYYTAQNRTTTVMPNTNKFCPSDTRGSTAGTETWKKATGGTNGTVVKIFELLGGGHQWYASNICSATGVHNSQFAVEFPNACPVANGGNGGTGFENAIVYEFFMQSSH